MSDGEAHVIPPEEVRLHDIARRIRQDTGMNRMDEFRKDSPAVVTLCGSTRFRPLFELANKVLTLHGIIVISLGLFGNEDKLVSDEEALGERVKRELDELHFHKIDHSDAILILNEGYYLGESAFREFKHAKRRGKRVYWYEKLPLSIREIVNQWAKNAKPMVDDAEVGQASPHSDSFAERADAMEWAKAFCDRFVGQVVSTDNGSAVDPGLMAGWFANAFAAGERAFPDMPLLSKQHLGILTNLYMASDAEVLTEQEEDEMEAFLGTLAEEHGYDGWVAAFHDLSGMGRPRYAEVPKKDLATEKDGFGVAGLKALPPEETLYADGKPMITVTIYPQGV